MTDVVVVVADHDRCGGGGGGRHDRCGGGGGGCHPAPNSVSIPSGCGVMVRNFSVLSLSWRLGSRVATTK